jgi:hypothetical protein
MLQADIDKFNQPVIAGNQQELATAPVKSNAYPRQDTLILTKDSKGGFQYDMEKVAKLASLKDPVDPVLADASMHAKNILLTHHIAYEVSKKQRDREMLRAARGVTVAAGYTSAAVSGGLSIAGVGAAVAATKAAGFAVATAGGVDVATPWRGKKQGMRDEKAGRIRDEYTKRIVERVPKAREGFRRPGVPGTDPQVMLDEEGQLVRDENGGPRFVVGLPSLPAETVMAEEMPKEALEALREATWIQSVEAVNKKREFLGVYPTSRGAVMASSVNEAKNYMAKKNRRDEMAKYAVQVVLSKMNDTGGTPAERIQMFKEALDDRNEKPVHKDKGIRALMETHQGAREANQLLLDFGCSKDEALQLMRGAMNVAILEHEAAAGKEAAMVLNAKAFGGDYEKGAQEMLKQAAQRR